MPVMKTALAASMFIFIPALALAAQPCAERAKVMKPVVSEKTSKIYQTKLTEGREAYTKNPNNPDAIIWLGRRTAYLGEYREAIKIFTEGIAKHPRDARFY